MVVFLKALERPGITPCAGSRVAIEQSAQALVSLPIAPAGLRPLRLSDLIDRRVQGLDDVEAIEHQGALRQCAPSAPM